MEHDYSRYNGPLLSRIYSGRRIRRELGEIPKGARKIPLTGIVGGVYLVDQMDKYRIDGDELNELIIEWREDARLITEKMFGFKR